MAAVTELATEVGTRAACHALFVPRGSYYRDRRTAFGPTPTTPRPLPVRALGPAERTAVLAHLHEERWSWPISTENAFRIARPPRFTRPCSMKGSTTARSAPCTACWHSGANPGNVATSSPIRDIRNQNCWRPLPISFGAGTSPSSWARRNGLTFTST